MRVKFILCLFIGVLLAFVPSIHGAGDAGESFDGKPSEKIGSVTSELAGEKHEFQAEVHRLMDIIINSLYSNRDIFLRELISNASDALDKLRFMSLTDASVLGEGDTAHLEIRISADEEAGTLTIRDRGIGMTRDDLINNLGTIARSGTSAFLDKVSDGGDISLIGQFGVGFYSAFLVADRVRVTSKHNDDDKQWIWESGAEDSFSIAEDSDGEPLGRGTSITLFLKEDAQEYMEQDKLREIVGRYSEFINFPIYLWVSEEVEVEVPVEDESDDDVEEVVLDDDEGDEIDIEDVEDDSDDDEPKMKTIKETQWKWEHVNENKAIWTRDPSEIEEDEYVSFYQALSKTEDSPMRYSHFKAEGEVEFRSILFIPTEPPYDMFDNYYSKGTGIKLYVRRVLITDEFEDLMPKYLNFVRGVVDSDDLPINVSRETLQESRILKVIKKKLVRKSLEMIRKIAEEDMERYDEEEEDEYADDVEDDVDDVDEVDDEFEEEEDEPVSYLQFWKHYGKNIKLGVVEDASNRARLSKLLRFYTSQCEEELCSLDDYVDRMKENQKTIYFVTGESRDVLEESPFVERLLKKDYEVLFAVDPVDEYLFQQLTEYEGFKFQSATKEGLRLDDENTDDYKEKEKLVKEAYKPLVKYLKETLSDKLEKVTLSNRLADSPCVLVTGQYGWSANMERIMRAQALNDPERFAFMSARKTMELNPHHPLVRRLLEDVNAGNSAEAENLATLLYDSAVLQSGFSLDDPNAFARRMHRLMMEGTGIDPDAGAVEDYSWMEVEEEEDEVDEFDEDDDGAKDEL
eukprot:Rmarinus@m.2614